MPCWLKSCRSFFTAWEAQPVGLSTAGFPGIMGHMQAVSFQRVADCAGIMMRTSSTLKAWVSLPGTGCMVLCMPDQDVCMPHLKCVGDLPDRHQEAASPAAAGLLLVLGFRLDEGLPQGTVVPGLAAAPARAAWGQERPCQGHSDMRLNVCLLWNFTSLACMSSSAGRRRTIAGAPGAAASCASAS